MHALDAVGVGVAEERALPAAEGVIRHGHRDRDVDADHADLDFVLEATRRAPVIREDRAAVPELIGIHERERVVVGVDTQHRKHGSEDLVRVEGHIGRDAVEQCRPEPEAAGITCDRMRTSVDDERRALARASVEITRDLVAMRGGDEGTHVGAVTTVTDVQVSDAIGDLADERVGDPTDGNDRGDRHAPLAGRTEAGVDGRVGGEVEIGVGQHDHVVLGAAQRLDPLAVSRRGLVHVPRDGRRADERDRLDIRMREQGIDRDLVALHDVEDTLGQSRLAPQLGEPIRRRRIFLTRLQDHAVARRDRDREEPARHHRREVERTDDCDDAEWLAQ